jgi:hypothetical protein
MKYRWMKKKVRAVAKNSFYDLWWHEKSESVFFLFICGLSVDFDF